MEILTYKPYTEENCICEYPNCRVTKVWCGKLAVWKGRDHAGPDSRPCYVCNEHHELLVPQAASSTEVTFIPSSLSEYLTQIEEESSALDSYPS